MYWCAVPEVVGCLRLRGWCAVPPQACVRSPVCWPSTQLRIRIGGDLGVPLARRWAVAWPGDPALGCTHSQECSHVHWGTGWGLGPGGARGERSAGDGVWWWIAHPNTPTHGSTPGSPWPWLEDEASAWPHDTIVLLFHTKWSPWVGSGERGGEGVVCESVQEGSVGFSLERGERLCCSAGYLPAGKKK